MTIISETIRILYIEDDALLAEMLQKSLSRLGYEIDIALNGDVGITMFGEQQYDVLIVDQKLPTLSGLDVIQHLNENNDIRIPTIILSATGNQELVTKALQFGVDDFQIKDMEGNYLRLMPLTIAKVIEQHRLRDEKMAAEEIAQRTSNRFKNLVENINDIICVVDQDTKILYMSPSGYNFSTNPETETHGIHLIHPDDVKELQKRLADVLKHPNASATMVIRLRHKSGVWHAFEGTATNLLHEPSIQGIVVNLHDVTEIHQAQKDLEQERNTLRVLIDSIPDHISVKDRTGDVILMNEQSRQAETDKNDTTQQLWKNLSDKMDIRVMETNTPIIRHEEKIEQNWYLINKIPLHDSDNDVSGVISIRSDITESKQREQNIMLHNQQLLDLQVASASIAANLNVVETLQVLAQEILKLTAFESCTISRWNKEDNTVETIVRYDIYKQLYVPTDASFDLAHYTKTKEVLTSWITVQQVIHDPDIDPQERDYLLKSNVQSSVMIPIIYGNTSIGLAELEDSRSEKRLDSNALLVVELLLHQAGIALENARLYEQSQHEIEERQRVEIALKESEEKLRATLTSIDDLLFTLDDSGVFLEYYQPADNVTKLIMSPHEFIGKHHKDVLPPHLSTLMEHAIEALKSSGEVQQIDYPLTLGGETLWFSAKISMRYDADGIYAGITVIARDVTENIKAQEEIRTKAQEIQQSARRYQALFEQANDAVLIMDRDANHIAVNQRACEMFGYTQGAFKQLQAPSLVSESDKVGWQNTWERLLKNEAVTLYEQNFQRSDGSIFPADVLIEVVSDDDSNVLHVQIIIRDITERKQFEESLLIQQRRLEALHVMATNSARTKSKLLTDALKLGCETLGMETGIISHIKHSDYWVENIYSNDFLDFDVGSKLELRNTFCELTFNRNRTIAINNVSELPHAASSCYETYRVESYLGEPLIVDDKIYGTIAFSSPHSRVTEFTEIDRTFIQLMAQWVATVIASDQAESELRESEERFRVMFEMAPIGIYLMTLDGHIRRANNAFCNLLGHDFSELQNKKIEDFLHPDESFDDMATSNQHPLYHVEKRFIDVDGNIVYALLRATWVQTSMNEPFYLMGQVIDITERKLAEEEIATHVSQLELLHAIEAELTKTLNIDDLLPLAVDTALRYSNAPYGYIALVQDDALTIAYHTGNPERDMRGYVIPPNSISWRVLENQKGELIADVTQDLDYRSSWSNTKAQITLPLTSSGREIGILGVETDDPTYFTNDVFDFMTLISRRVASAIDNAQLYAQTQHQLGRLRILHEQIVEQATHDPLTKLPNRALFQERLDGAIESANGSQVGLLYIDLDGFKRVNDTLGHPVGDQLLIEVGERLQACVRENDTVARMGGDEFTVILPELKDLGTAFDIAERILQTVREPYILKTQLHYISASIGMSFYPIDGTTTSELLRKADTALYLSKESGKNTVNQYDTIANRKVIEHVMLGNMLHEAINHNQLLMHYQPQVNLKTGEVVGIEALIRWQLPSKQMVPPSKFLPIANDVGMLIPITNWVFSEVCKQQQVWWDAGLRLTLSVNIAIPQFQQVEFVDMLKQIVNQYDYPPNKIELEVTEQLMMNDLKDAAAKLTALRDFGFKVALDDFGTGYSSLSYLQKLPIDTLKIDRSLVMDVDGDTETSQKSVAIIKAIISLAQSLGIVVVAEGVETASQQEHLRQLEVDIAQGYLLSHAIPASDIQGWLKNYQS